MENNPQEEIFIDYYNILQCDRNATDNEIKKNYQNLALKLHPDKKADGESNNDFLLLQKAWTVLRDPQSKKQYDAELSCQEHSDVLLYDTVSLAGLEFDGQLYTYPCRCGGNYTLEHSDSMPPVVLVPCNECSFSIQINL